MAKKDTPNHNAQNAGTKPHFKEVVLDTNAITSGGAEGFSDLCRVANLLSITISIPKLVIQELASRESAKLRAYLQTERSFIFARDPLVSKPHGFDWFSPHIEKALTRLSPRIKVIETAGSLQEALNQILDRRRPFAQKENGGSSGAKTDHGLKDFLIGCTVLSRSKTHILLVSHDDVAFCGSRVERPKGSQEASPSTAEGTASDSRLRKLHVDWKGPANTIANAVPENVYVCHTLQDAASILAAGLEIDESVVPPAVQAALSAPSPLIAKSFGARLNKWNPPPYCFSLPFESNYFRAAGSPIITSWTIDRVFRMSDTAFRAVATTRAACDFHVIAKVDAATNIAIPPRSTVPLSDGTRLTALTLNAFRLQGDFDFEVTMWLEYHKESQTVKAAVGTVAILRDGRPIASSRV